MDKAWKACERRIAKYIGGTRIPVTGRQRGDAADIDHPWLSPEVKYRKKLPEWMKDALRQAKASARGNQTPIVIMCEKGMDVGRCWAIFELEEVRDRWL
jgi:hypothetical protein